MPMQKNKSTSKGKKKYAAGGGVGPPKFSVSSDFLTSLFQQSGADPSLLDRIRKQGLDGIYGQAAADIAGKFANPSATMAKSAPKASIAERAGAQGGQVGKKGITRKVKGKKYI
tara:strand:- start:741 stop:1082 length:342 start_codon:yes stop_codon:yes gene_type:complete